MIQKLSELAPRRVFYYFEKICSIPHTSYNTKQLSDFLVEFANEHNLEYTKDENGNVLIVKPASAGYEAHPGVILQGHIDMVGAAASGISHDFQTEPIEIITDSPKPGFISANQTTLGADNGIAVAFLLAILEDNSLKHPRMEALFTVDEEVGLLGAKAFDVSLLTGKYFINLDSEEEGFFLTACAGGIRVDLCLDKPQVLYEGLNVELTIDGLKGGHSGSDIHLGRASANVLMGRLLKKIDETEDFYIQFLKGGVVDNAICPKCTAGLVISEKDFSKINEICISEMNNYNSEYSFSEEHIHIMLEKKEQGEYSVADDITKEKILCMLRTLPQGVISYDPLHPDNDPPKSNALRRDVEESPPQSNALWRDVEESPPQSVALRRDVAVSPPQSNALRRDVKVITSLNLGVLRYTEGHLKLGYSIRSSITSAKYELAERIEYLAEFMGGYYEESGDYPAWEYKPHSDLREKIDAVFSDMYNRKPVFTTIHAGLECGIFYSKNNDFDIISYGPNMFDVHTDKECLEIQSVERVYNFTIKLLANL